MTVPLRAMQIHPELSLWPGNGLIAWSCSSTTASFSQNLSPFFPLKIDNLISSEKNLRHAQTEAQQINEIRTIESAWKIMKYARLGNVFLLPF